MSLQHTIYSLEYYTLDSWMMHCYRAIGTPPVLWSQELNVPKRKGLQSPFGGIGTRSAENRRSAIPKPEQDWINICGTTSSPSMPPLAMIIS